MTLPMVSCLMFTRDHLATLPGAVDCWLAQDWASKELIIVDDGTESAESLVPSGNENIRYFRVTGPQVTLGAKRRRMVDMVRGEYMTFWSDMDFSAPTRLKVQMEAALAAHKQVCLLSSTYAMNLVDSSVWLFTPSNLSSLGYAAVIKYPPHPALRSPVRHSRQDLLSRIPEPHRVLLDQPDLYMRLVSAEQAAETDWNSPFWALVELEEPPTP